MSLGLLFVLLAGVGIIKMPDFYLRISVTTKAATLGIGLILLATAVYFQDFAITTRVIAIIFFVILTAPVGAHIIGKAAYIVGVKMWDKTKIDDLENMYDKRTKTLKSKKFD